MKDSRKYSNDKRQPGIKRGEERPGIQEETENLSVEELVRMAEDESVKMPAGLHEGLSDLVDGLDAVEKIRVPGFFRSGSARLWIAGIAAAVALAVVLGGEAYRNRTPKDTFDDPMEALAFMQERMNGVGERISKGLKCLDSTREAASSNLWILKSEQNKD